MARNINNSISIKPLPIIDEDNIPKRNRNESMVLDERLVTVSDLTSTLRTESEDTIQNERRKESQNKMPERLLRPLVKGHDVRLKTDHITI